jgi:hypothetical protein
MASRAALLTAALVLLPQAAIGVAAIALVLCESLAVAERV